MFMSRTLIVVAVAGVGVFAGIGALAIPLGAIAAMVMGAMLVSICTFAVACGEAGEQLRHRAPLRVALVAGGGVAGTGLALAGMITVLGAATIPVLMLAVLLAAPQLRRRRMRPATESGGVDPTVDTDVIVGLLLAPPEPPDVAGWTTPQLCAQWRRSYADLQHARDTQAWQQVIAARQSYLDELERRDPAGFQQWLDDGARAAGDPSRFLTSDP